MRTLQRIRALTLDLQSSSMLLFRPFALADVTNNGDDQEIGRTRIPQRRERELHRVLLAVFVNRGEFDWCPASISGPCPVST